VRVHTHTGERVKKLEAHVVIDAKRHLTLGLMESPSMINTPRKADDERGS